MFRQRFFHVVTLRVGTPITVQKIARLARPLPRAHRRALTYVDQGLSSTTNLVATVLAAGVLSPNDFGAFAVAASVMVIALGLIRSATGVLLVIYLPTSTEERANRLWRGALSTAAVMGVVAAAILSVVGLSLHGPAGRAVLAIGVAVPAVAVQDVVRHRSLALLQPMSACRSDSAWLVCLVILMVGFRSTASGSLVFVVWAGYLSAVFGLIGVGPWWREIRLRAVTNWLNEQGRGCLLMGGDFLLALSYGAVPLALLTAVNADLQQAGSIRVAQTVMGPLVVLFTATSLHLQPVIAALDRSANHAQRVGRIAFRQSSFNLVVAVGWLVMATRIPSSLGTRLFGSTWEEADEAVQFVGLAFVGLAVSTGPLTALRALSQLRANFIAQFWTAALVWVSIVLAGWLASRGTLIGFAFGNLGGALVSAVFLSSVLRRGTSRSAP